MGETEQESASASCRDHVTGLIEAGAPFAVVENAIDERADLTEEGKAALWLFAFSMRDRDEPLERARAHPPAAPA
jgi:hypothetical protein